MKTTDLRGCIAVVCLSLLSAAAFADVLVYKDGRSLEGTLVSQDDKQIVFDCRRGPATVRLVLKPDEVENVRTTLSATQPSETTQEATAAPDAFGAMQSVAIQAKRELRPIPPVPSNATQAQRGQLEAQRSVKWEEMRTRIIAIRDGLNGQQCMVSGTVEDVVAKDGGFVVLLSRVAYTPPADLSEARSLAAAAASRRRRERNASPMQKALGSLSQKMSPSPTVGQYSRAASNAAQAANSEARSNRLYHAVYLLTDDQKIGDLHKGASLPMTLATIQETHLYLAEGKEVDADWDGKGYWSNPMIVQCIATSE